MNRYLIGFDFDGTIAKTYEKSPSGIGVYEAYQMAIADLLGPNVVEEYNNLNGRESMSPLEIIAHLTIHNTNNDSESVLHQANDLVRRKLSILISQIGQRFDDGSMWPPEEPGFRSVWEEIEALNSRGGFEIKTAVISSGHREFIRKTFDVYDLRQPDYLVTEDEVRGRKYPFEIARRVKPGTLQMAMVHRQWLRDLAIHFGDGNREKVQQTRDNILYIGDSELKDGGMAVRSGVSFLHYSEKAHTWDSIHTILDQGQELFQRGGSFGEIIGKHQRIVEGNLGRAKEHI